MAKKKKKSADARGYATTAMATQPKPTAVRVSSKTENYLVGLLDALNVGSDKDGATTLSSSSRAVVRVIPSKALEKKVTVLHDALVDYGFSEAQIVAALRAILTNHTSTAKRDPKQQQQPQQDPTSLTHLTQERALDWLCWNVPAEELPPLFCESNTDDRRSLEDDANQGPLQVLVSNKRNKSTNNPDENNAVVSELQTWVPSLTTPNHHARDEEEETKNKEKDDANRAWLLQQYQYEEEEDNHRNTEKEDIVSTKSSVNVTKEAQGGKQDDTQNVIVMTEKERRLQEMEAELKELAETIQDDVANYMRSKHELIDLKKRQRILQKQIGGWRNKVATEKAERQQTEVPRTTKDHGITAVPVDTLSAVPSASMLVSTKESTTIHVSAMGDDDAPDGTDDVALLSMFDEAEESGSTPVPLKEGVPESGIATDIHAATTTVTASTSPAYETLDSFTMVRAPSSRKKKSKKKAIWDTPSIPKDWTGKTPRTMLEEWCAKRKVSKPQYQRLSLSSSSSSSSSSKNGCRVVIPKTLTIEQEGPFDSFADAHHYLATEALYQLNPTLPMYRLFPPIFRDLWKSWIDQVAAQKDEEFQARKQSKQKKMQNIIQSIAEPSTTTTVGAPTTSTDKNKLTTRDNDGEESEDQNLPLPTMEHWDDSDASSQEEESSATEPTNSSTATTETTPSKPIQSMAGETLKKEFIARQKTRAYQSMSKMRESLPMYSYRNQLLKTIRENAVTVLCAETGAGKTTQCGQYLLEEALLSGTADKLSILCTQPRRISAISVAERVAEELCDRRVGDSIGYHIRMESKQTRGRTKLLFCTTGVVLRRLQDDPNLEGITHILVDEVHERQWQIDFLLIALRKLISTTRKDLKVVLMSATLDSKLFCSFFQNAPFLSVPGRTFPVSNYYLEDLMDATDHIIEEGSRYAIRTDRNQSNTASLWVTTRGGEKRREVVSFESQTGPVDVTDAYSGYKMSTRRSMDRVDEKVLNYDLIEDVMKLLLIENPENNDILVPPEGTGPEAIKNGSVLVFLPGLGEIRALTERLRGSRQFGDSNRFEIIPMHSTLSPKDQRRAFSKSKQGCQKIILSTNICETSVTIPDVVCVIDSGLGREIRQNKRSSTSALVLDWCSKASAKQRAGRAGRVQPGVACKLYSSNTANRTMYDQAMPELQRVPLEEVCLSILAGGLANNCMDFLQQAPQPPSEDSVKAALKLLEEVGAIEPIEQYSGVGSRQSSQEQHKLTPLGCHLARIPVHVRLGKMLIFGALFKCLDKILTVAASLSCKSPFSTYVDNAQQASAAHRQFAHPTSDFLTICNVWDAYQDAWSESESTGRRFCDKNWLSRAALMEIGDMRRQFLDLLSQIGFVSKIKRPLTEKGQSGKGRSTFLPDYNINGTKEEVVGAVICAGLYPNVAHAIKQATGVPALWHRNERVYFHSSSVNHKKVDLASDWVVFHEKFETNRVSVSATSLVKPFALLLFGSSVVVKHTERKVIVDEWIELKVAARTGVMFREVRNQVESFLKSMIEDAGDSDQRGNTMIDGIVKLLTNE